MRPEPEKIRVVEQYFRNRQRRNKSEGFWAHRILPEIHWRLRQDHTTLNGLDKEVLIRQSEECRYAFNTLKEELCKSPVST